MKKMLIGVFAAALIMVPATAFAAQTKPTQLTPAAVGADAEGAETDLYDCCYGYSAPCCNTQAAAGCCAR